MMMMLNEGARSQTSGDAQTTRVVVVGAGGRVGRLLCDALASGEGEAEGMQLVGAVVSDRSELIGEPCTSSRSGQHGEAILISADFTGLCDLIIDFSSDEGARKAVRIAQRAGAALLSATTGLSAPTTEMIRHASAGIAILRAANTSLGVAACADLVERAAQLLGPEYRVEIVEAHHRHKKDAPSGTALMLAQAARKGGAAISSEAGNQIHSLRGGDVVGEHIVRFAADGEYIEIMHRATSRTLFARGALRAGEWLVKQRPGLYAMADVLRSVVLTT